MSTSRLEIRMSRVHSPHLGSSQVYRPAVGRGGGRNGVPGRGRVGSGELVECRFVVLGDRLVGFGDLDLWDWFGD